MLPISANSNFGTVTQQKTVFNTYTDLNGRACNEDLYGTAAINQAIENVICTMPGECLFNVALCSPLYEILFNNYTAGLEEQIFTKIELFVNVTIDRNSAQFDFDPASHVLYVSFPWTTNDGKIVGIFKRHIGR